MGKRYKFTQCFHLKGVLNRAPKVDPYGAIFCSILAINRANYNLLPGKRLTPKTLNLTPPELMKYAG